MTYLIGLVDWVMCNVHEETYVIFYWGLKSKASNMFEANFFSFLFLIGN